MIPATHWVDGEDGTAWWVFGPPWTQPELQMYDRPCDTCGGRGVAGATSNGLDGYQRCTDCDGTGRHTFDVKVEPYPYGGCPSCGDSGIGRAGDGFCSSCMYPDRHRVSVVPGMILPIVDNFEWPETHASVDTLGNVWEPGIARDGEPEWRLIDHAQLPPAAAPNMWAIQLRKADR